MRHAALALTVALLVPAAAMAQSCEPFATPNADDRVFDAVVWNGDLVIAGAFDNVGGVAAKWVARWDGSQWHAMGQPVATGSFFGVQSLGVYQGDLYCSPTSYLSSAKLLRWIGGDWDLVGEIESMSDGTIMAMIEWEGLLVVGGDFYGHSWPEADKAHIAAWNGSGWQDMGTPMNYGLDFWPQFDFEIYQGQLYVAGKFDRGGAEAIHGLARWNGVDWEPVYGWAGGVLAQGLFETAGATDPGRGKALCEWNGKLVVGGNFSQVGNLVVENLVSWDGGTQTWSAIGGDIEGSRVISALDYFGLLVVGGIIDSAAGTPVQAMARWDGANWSAFPPIMNPWPNPEAHVLMNLGGRLFIGGSGDFAAWSCVWVTPVGDAAPIAMQPILRAYPNPANPRATIQFVLEEAGVIDLRIRDARGRHVRTLASGRRFDAGEHDLPWDGRDEGGRSVASGVYTARLMAGRQSAGTSVVFLK